jgi:ABC-2 type transport system permease protein
VPILSFDEAQAEHPVLFRLNQAAFPFTAPVATVGDGLPDVEQTTLARSSEISWLLTGDSIGLQPRLPREWQQTGREGPFPVMVALRGKLPNAFAGAEQMSGGEDAPTIEAPAQAEDARVLVAGTGFFMRDEIMGQAQPGDCDISGPLALALNAVDWLAQDSDLVAIRAKSVEEPAIEVPQSVRVAEEEARTAAESALSAAQEGDEGAARSAIDEQQEALERRKTALAEWDRKKALYRWGNMLGIPLLFGFFGLVRWQTRRNKRRNIKL